jgi:hypothetical protein
MALPVWPRSASSRKRPPCRFPVRWWPRGAVAGTTGFARPGLATAHPAAWPTSTGAAAAAACSPHPANTSPAAATAGCAFKVYRYVARGVLDEREVTLAFTAVALDLGLDHAEIGRTLASARTAGLANPRTIPATPDPSRQEVGP